MYLKSLRLKDFRLYEDELFEFSPTVNVIHGPNARGKTTILEAIYLLIAGRSFRTSQIKDLIRHGAEQFYVEAQFVKHGIEQTLKFGCDGKSRRIIYNNTPCKTFANLYGLLNGVAMTPDDVSLIKGGPAERRQFLDLQLAQVDPLYVHHIFRYMRAMRQRNILLKRRSVQAIETWEAEMSRAAGYIILQRRGVSQALESAANQVHEKISQSAEALALRYKTSAPEESIQEYYADMWRRHRPRELDVGMTLSGPHRDDLLVLVEGKEARHFASEGQQRSSIASLRLAGWEQLKKQAGAAPLMLVDDVGISLDANRRRQIYSHLASLQQVFLTSTENLDVPSDCLQIAL